MANVRFSYPGSNGNGPAIRDANLNVEAGERVGIVGRTGCGKSTLVKLLLRLYHPDGGHISLDGLPIDEVSRDHLAQRVGYVSQNPFLFSGSVEQNIAYGACVAKRSQVEEVARRARIHDEIVNELGGYDAPVSERGANLSGGQRQRIALARLFLKNPSLLILDEATSALDNATEAAVLAALDELAAGRTLIAIAHRLNTIRRMDRILVMDHGRIVEGGTYSDLVHREGPFRSLCEGMRAGVELAA